MMRKLFMLILVLFSTAFYAQKKYIEKQDGQIVDEISFENERLQQVEDFKKKLSPGKYFDIIYEFEELRTSEDSIVLKIKTIQYSSAPPQINLRWR